MRIGIAGPVDLGLLDYPEGCPSDLPAGYPAPVIAHVVNALLRRGHHLVVFTTSLGLSQPLVIDQGRLIVCVAPQSRPRSALTFFRSERRWLRRLMAEHPADLIHASWSYEFALAGLQSGLPTIVHYRDHAWTILRHKRDAYRFLRWLLSVYVTMRAEHKVANSEYLKRAFGRSGRNMVVIPNFLPASALPGREDFARCASRIVVVSNGFTGRKNVAVALDAFSLLRQRCPDARLVLIGVDLGEGQVAAEYAQRNGLDAGVSFKGSQSYKDTLVAIRGSAVLLHPALEESFGMTILEAMAVGTPVVAGQRSGNVPELLGHGECGLLCDATDPESVAEALEATLTDTEEVADRVEHGRERYQTIYSEDSAADRLEALYRLVASGSLERARGAGR